MVSAKYCLSDLIRTKLCYLHAQATSAETFYLGLQWPDKNGCVGAIEPCLSMLAQGNSPVKPRVNQGLKFSSILSLSCDLSRQSQLCDRLRMWPILDLSICDNFRKYISKFWVYVNNPSDGIDWKCDLSQKLHLGIFKNPGQPKKQEMHNENGGKRTFLKILKFIGDVEDWRDNGWQGDLTKVRF